jgi:HPt (histidine-containing phosphotransfer) domain-containing protein
MTSSKPVGAVDFDYLEGFAAGDRTVVDEVLSLFRQESERWAKGLDVSDPNWRDMVHTIKGAGRGVGAFALGDACARAEAGASLDEVVAALNAAVAEITAYQATHKP